MIWPVAKASPGIQDITLANVPAIDAHAFGEHIHDAFHGEVRLVGAEAAHGAAGRIVGEHGLGLGIHVRDAIRAAGVTRGAQQAFRAGAGIAAHVSHDAAAHGQQVTLGVGAHR